MREIDIIKGKNIIDDTQFSELKSLISGPNEQEGSAAPVSHLLPITNSAPTSASDPDQLQVVLPDTTIHPNSRGESSLEQKVAKNKCCEIS